MGAGKKLGTDHVNLDQKVYGQLKTMILNQNLKSGSKIYQEKLAEDLGISRTPLVNALKKLEQENMITAIPRKGFYVREFSRDEMVYIFELREVLEGLAARRAAKRITPGQIQKIWNLYKGLENAVKGGSVEKCSTEDRRFHYFIIQIGGDEHLTNMLETYSVITFSYLVKFRGGLVRPPHVTLSEHLAITEGISAKDPERAEHAMRLHFRRSSDKLAMSSDSDFSPEP